jgi:5-methylcytosine-specific restriction endonuclease McrA
VKEREPACRDCGRTELLQFDHVPPFEQTLHTVVEELEVRCSPCHRKRHGR